MKTTAGALWMLLIMLVAREPVSALPRFAGRTGARCQSCHENPSGGGMRKPFGVTYGQETLPVPAWSEQFSLDDFSTKLTDFVSIGADVRTLYFYIQRPDTGNPAKGQDAENAFFQMQGDFYMNLRIAKHVSVYLKKGLYTDGGRGFEVFGLLSVLPANGFLKIGKFVPNYGIKIDDHRAFIRQELGFSPERGTTEVTGGEVAVSPGPLTVTGGFYNATDGYGVGTGNDKAFLGRVEGAFKIAENAYASVGGNVFSRKVSGLRTTLYGGFGSLSYENLTIVGEADVIKNNKLSNVNGIVMYVEADYVVTPGLDLKVGYDFYDPDKDQKTGAFSRYSVGFEFFPLSGVEVRPLYRIMKEEPTDVKNNEFNVLIHFYL